MTWRTLQDAYFHAVLPFEFSDCQQSSGREAMTLTTLYHSLDSLLHQRYLCRGE